MNAVTNITPVSKGKAHSCVSLFDPHTLSLLTPAGWAFHVSSNVVTPSGCLAGDSIKSRRLRAQSHKTAPSSSDACRKSGLLPVLLTSWL